jgi:hypothetical protein
MRNIKERYLVDDNGNRIGVVLIVFLIIPYKFLSLDGRGLR